LPNKPQQSLQTFGAPSQQAGMQAVKQTGSSQPQRRQQGSHAVNSTFMVGTQTGSQQSPFLRSFAAEADAGVNETTATATSSRPNVNRIKARIVMSPGGRIANRCSVSAGTGGAHKMTHSY
jgi:hypothetical protein